MSNLTIINSRKATVETDNGKMTFYRNNNGTATIKYEKDFQSFDRVWHYPKSVQGVDALNKFIASKTEICLREELEHQDKPYLRSRNDYAVICYIKKSGFLVRTEWDTDEETHRGAIVEGAYWLHTWLTNEVLTAPQSQYEERIKELEKEVERLTRENNPREQYNDDAVLSWTSGYADSIVKENHIPDVMALMKKYDGATVRNVAQGLAVRAILKRNMSNDARRFINLIFTRDEIQEMVDRIKNDTNYIIGYDTEEIYRNY